MYAEAWAAMGHTVTVLTGWGRDLPRREHQAGVDIVRVGPLAKKRRATAGWIYMASYLFGAAWLVVGQRRALADHDIVNTHFALPTGPLGWFTSRMLRLPHVLTIIGGDVYDPTKRGSPHRHGLLRLVNRWLMNAADSLIAISSDTAARARQHYGIERDIHVVNYGFAPTPPREVAGVEAEGFVLIAVGRLVERKGFEHLLGALARLPDDVRLWIVGDGPLDERLAHRAEELGVASRVRWFGYRTPAEIAWLLREADCFVLSSLHEGMGIVVQEAMNAGLPVVATNNGGQVDLIAEEHNGLLVRPGDAPALADAIERMHESPETRSRMGTNNRREIRRFESGRNAGEYVEVFRTLLEAS
jgi:glycosyltransferase involved in cell wall biosynthesis